MPSPEIKEWIALIKDSLLGAAALVSIVIAIYGVRMWKRELAGKEIYTATKALVKESHLLYKASLQARRPIEINERQTFSDHNLKNTTTGERWRLSEVEAYKERIREFSVAISRYQAALLEVRVLTGSKVYLGFLPFGRLITEVIYGINNYLAVLDESSNALPDDPNIQDAQRALYPSDNLDDDLTQRIGDAREDGEKGLLVFLHRKSIRD
jgi:hypothetical protein